MSKFLVNIDLNKNQLQNAVLQPLAITPSNPVEGQFYYNSTDKLMHQWNGTEWVVYGETVNWGTIAGKPDGLVIDTNYVHTDNNFTNDDNTKLQGIEAGAEVNPGVATEATDGLMSSTDKTKLNGIEAGAEVNVNANWDATSGDAQILNKPTKLSQFTNDSGFVTNAVDNLTNYYLKTETYSQEEVNTLIGQVATISTQVVDVLPTTGEANVIYLVPHGGSTTSNYYDEYLWINNTWEMIGTTQFDLSNYLTKSGLASTTGTATNNAMSQAAVTSALGEKANTDDLSPVAMSGLYSDLTGTPKPVQIATATIATTATSATVNVNGNIMGVMVFDNVTKAQVMCDVSYTSGTLASRGQVTVSTASAPTNTLNVVVFYIAS